MGTTLLNALARGKSEAASGSARHQPNVGVGKVPDPRLNALADLVKPEKVVPAEIKWWDVPASSDDTADGAGFSGQVLNLLQSADALLHVVRAFDDPMVPHHRPNMDPQRDAADMEAELVFADLAILERRRQRIDVNLKGAKGRERDLLLQEGALLSGLQEGLEKELPICQQQLSPEEMDTLASYNFLTSKPLLVVFNVAEEQLSVGPSPSAISDGERPRPGLVTDTICAKLELELSQLAPEEETEFRSSMGLQESGLDRIVRLCYGLLGLISFYTYVSKEVRAWTVPQGTPAPKAAGRIHSDMERGFIRAEVIGLDDLSRCGSIAQAKRAGLVRLEGKSYAVRDGDVITFLFNV